MFGQVINREGKIAVFGHKQGRRFEKRAAQPPPNSSGRNRPFLIGLCSFVFLLKVGNLGTDTLLKSLQISRKNEQTMVEPTFLIISKKKLPLPLFRDYPGKLWPFSIKPTFDNFNSIQNFKYFLFYFDCLISITKWKNKLLITF